MINFKEYCEINNIKLVGYVNEEREWKKTYGKAKHLDYYEDDESKFGEYEEKNSDFLENY